MLPDAPLPDVTAVAALVVAAAQAEILPRFMQVQRSHKADGSVVTEADVVMQQRLQQALAANWPIFGFMGEEMTPAAQQAAFDHLVGVWCLDPLDGTGNFASGMPLFGVSLALLIAGRPVLGVVYDPVRAELFYAAAGQGAFLNGQRLQLAATGLALNQSLAVVDFKRLDLHLRLKVCSQAPYRSQRNLGTCALEWCWLAAGRFQVYLHGGQNLWDYAAGCLILAEAGGYAQTLAGHDFQRLPLSPNSVIAAVDAPLFAAWKAAILD
jgi:myo-inositol-1(or 4)-monophosphatase